MKQKTALSFLLPAVIFAASVFLNAYDVFSWSHIRGPASSYVYRIALRARRQTRNSCTTASALRIAESCLVDDSFSCDVDCTHKLPFIPKRPLLENSTKNLQACHAFHSVSSEKLAAISQITPPSCDSKTLGLIATVRLLI